MHISIVSSSTKKLVPPDLEKSKALDLHTVKSLQSAFDNKTPLEIVFFDADLGEKSIIQQISLCPAQWLVINMENNIQQALQYLQLGASGILTSPLTDEKLQRSIQSIATKTLYIDDDLQQILAFRQIQKMLQPFSELSSREFDIFCLLAENVSIQEVAEQLSITTKTAFNCQTQLRQKLGLKNQQQIIHFAKSHSLIF